VTQLSIDSVQNAQGMFNFRVRGGPTVPVDKEFLEQFLITHTYFIDSSSLLNRLTDRLRESAQALAQTAGSAPAPSVSIRRIAVECLCWARCKRRCVSSTL
jgi:hypothetical protein